MAFREILLTLPPGGGNIPVECVEVTVQDLYAEFKAIIRCLGRRPSSGGCVRLCKRPGIARRRLAS